MGTPLNLKTCLDSLEIMETLREDERSDGNNAAEGGRRTRKQEEGAQELEMMYWRKQGYNLIYRAAMVHLEGF